MSPELTPRQLEIAALVGDGESYRVIGRRLRISPATVRVHVAAIDRAIGHGPLTPYRNVMRWVLERRAA